MPRWLVGLAIVGAAGCGKSAEHAAPDGSSPPLDAATADGSEPIGASGPPDLQFVAAQMTDTVVVTADDFTADDCEVAEQCVGGTGRRILLRFDTVTANLGGSDLVLGAPPPPGVSNDVFQWSPCHMHHHVANYASYELLDSTGTTVLTGRKQAFCLEDDEQIDPGVNATGYSCTLQGISRGWADSYNRYLPCQWLDVTGVASGGYTLRVTVNPLRTLPESDYDNNVFTVPVQL